MRANPLEDDLQTLTKRSHDRSDALLEEIRDWLVQYQAGAAVEVDDLVTFIDSLDTRLSEGAPLPVDWNHVVAFGCAPKQHKILPNPTIPAGTIVMVCKHFAGANKLPKGAHWGQGDRVTVPISRGREVEVEWIAVCPACASTVTGLARRPTRSCRSTRT